MSISNNKKATISYDHRHKIKPLFERYVKGNLGLAHFSVNIFFGDSQNIFLSPTPEMAEELCKKNFVNEDSNYKPEIYQNHSIYPWKSVQKHDTDRTINFIKEEKFGMRSGMMIVRDLGNGKYVMYSLATKFRDKADFAGQFQFLFYCKANYIAEMGDFMYNSLRPVINEYTEQENVHMPEITESMPLKLESNFQHESQHEMFEIVNSVSHMDLQKLLLKNKQPTLKLINGGKLER